MELAVEEVVAPVVELPPELLDAGAVGLAPEVELEPGAPPVGVVDERMTPRVLALLLLAVPLLWPLLSPPPASGPGLEALLPHAVAATTTSAEASE